MITGNYYSFMCVKPLNPILGETFQIFGHDGSRQYLEQTSHHPPRSHWIADGPEDEYNSSGWCEFDVK